MKETKDIYQIITDKIISKLEEGIIPWNKPWKCVDNLAISHINGKAYSLLNQLLLDEGGEYLTYKQVEAEKGFVKKGSKAKMVVFWKQLIIDEKDENGNIVRNEEGEAKKKIIPCLRYYQVFNIKDCEGIKPKYQKKDNIEFTEISLNEMEAEAENIFKAYIEREGITFEEGLSNRAYFSPSEDKIHLPLRKQFSSNSEYFSTAFHEATHSTGVEKRLNRKGMENIKRFGDKEYSKEELVAEIGSAYIMNKIGLEIPKTFQNSVAYIQGWLKALRNDKRLIVFASCLAEKACKFILNEKAEEAEKE